MKIYIELLLLLLSFVFIPDAVNANAISKSINKESNSDPIQTVSASIKAASSPSKREVPSPTATSNVLGEIFQALRHVLNKRSANELDIEPGAVKIERKRRMFNDKSGRRNTVYADLDFSDFKPRGRQSPAKAGSSSGQDVEYAELDFSKMGSSSAQGTSESDSEEEPIFVSKEWIQEQNRRNRNKYNEGYESPPPLLPRGSSGSAPALPPRRSSASGWDEERTHLTLAEAQKQKRQYQKQLHNRGRQHRPQAQDDVELMSSEEAQRILRQNPNGQRKYRPVPPPPLPPKLRRGKRHEW